MGNVLQETILEDWGGIKVIADIDEKLEDVMVAVKYSDHGDDFLFVKTKDGHQYEYGWYIGRRDVFCPDYNELIESPYNWEFIRKPKLYCEYDERCSLSNKIYWHVMDNFDNGHHFRVPSIDEPKYAQMKFDNYVRFMDEIYNRGVTYHKEQDKDFIEKYLKKNNISTEENLNKLYSVKFTSGENGIDGTAGKKGRYVGQSLIGDRVKFVWYNGKFQNLERLRIKYYYDRDYNERFELFFSQFK